MINTETSSGQFHSFNGRTATLNQKMGMRKTEKGILIKIQAFFHSILIEKKPRFWRGFLLSIGGYGTNHRICNCTGQLKTQRNKRHPGDHF